MGASLSTARRQTTLAYASCGDILNACRRPGFRMLHTTGFVTMRWFRRRIYPAETASYHHTILSHMGNVHSKAIIAPSSLLISVAMTMTNDAGPVQVRAPRRTGLYI